MLDIISYFSPYIDEHKLLHKQEDLIAYSSDASLLAGLPSLVVLVENSQDMKTAVHICCDKKLKFLVRGKATGYTGGCVPKNGDVVISTENWRGILSYDALNETVVVAPGTTISEINEFGSDKNLFFPPDPISKDHCTLGGAVSENSSGPRCLRYGPLHCFIEEFQLFGSDGQERVISKYDTHDMSDYFYSIVGGEGTLGAVGWVKCRLVQKPKENLIYKITFNDVGIINKLLDRCFESGIPFSAMEMVTPSYHTSNGIIGSYYLLLEYFSYTDHSKAHFFNILSEYVKDLPVELVSIDGDMYAQRGLMYQTNRKLINDCIRENPISLLIDGVVPRTSLQLAVTQLFHIAQKFDTPMLHTFHFGDGNIHPTFFFANNTEGKKLKHLVLEDVMNMCLKLGGSLAAEHGIGLEKVDYLPAKHSKSEINEFCDIKNRLDTNQLINMGKIIPAQIDQFISKPSKFDISEHIKVDRINMVVIVDADTNYKYLCDQCSKQNLNLGYLALGQYDNKSVLEVIRNNYKNLLSKRHGELRDSILGVQFIDKTKQSVTFGDTLVKNVSGYNICRSDKTLNGDVTKLCLRVYHNNNNKYYIIHIPEINPNIFQLLNKVSVDFTPLICNTCGKLYAIIQSPYSHDEISSVCNLKTEEIKQDTLKDIQVLDIEQLSSSCDNIPENCILNYQKEEMYICK